MICSHLSPSWDSSCNRKGFIPAWCCVSTLVVPWKRPQHPVLNAASWRNTKLCCRRSAPQPLRPALLMSCLHTLSWSHFFLFPLKWENRFKANKIEQFVLSVLSTGHLPVQAPSPTKEYPLFSVSNNWTLLSRDVYDRARSLIIFISLCAALFDGPWQLSSQNLGIMCFPEVAHSFFRGYF